MTLEPVAIPLQQICSSVIAIRGKVVRAAPKEWIVENLSRSRVKILPVNTQLLPWGHRITLRLVCCLQLGCKGLQGILRHWYALSCCYAVRKKCIQIK